MAFEFVFEGESLAGATVELDVVISSDGEGLTVGGEGVVGDWVVEELVDLWGCHDGKRGR